MFFAILLIISSFDICNGSQQFYSDGINNDLCSVPEIEHGGFNFPFGKVQYTPGDPPPNFPVSAYCTNEKYVLNTTYVMLYCVNGKFEKDLPKCVLACPARISTHSVDVQCTLNGVEQNCSRKVPEGTIAKMKCKPQYVELSPGFSTAACVGGSWNVPQKQCEPDCGISKTIIVNGTDVKRGEFPWHVLIYVLEANEPIKYFCGGSLISEKIVLTDENCIYPPHTYVFRSYKFNVAAGKIFSKWDAPEDSDFVQIRNIAEIEFTPFDGIAFHVEKPFVLTDFIKPVCVDWNSEYVNQQLKKESIGITAGWNDTNADGSLKENSNLIQLSIPLIEISTCNNKFNESIIYLTNDINCPGNIHRKLKCIRTLGTGLVYPHEQFGKIKYYIQGIETISTGNNYTCGIKFYSKITSFSLIRNRTSLN